MRRAIAVPELRGRVFTSEDARAVGLSYKQLRSCAYRRLFHDVYVDAAAPDTLELRAAAIGLALPAGAVVGYTAAAWLHGADVRDRRSPAIEVIAQSDDQIRRAGIADTSALLAPEDVTE